MAIPVLTLEDLLLLSTHLSYRPDIDGLRAIAVLSVVFCHAGLSFAGGYVGVDVFFVISGYLITSLILKDLAKGTFSLAEFWERRIRRIAPALVGVTAVTLIAGWFLLLPSDYRELGKSVVGLAAMLSNVQFWRETGYFEKDAESQPLLHTWSLAVEEQFYLLVPGLLLLITRFGMSRYIAPLLSLMATLSFILSAYGTATAPDATFYLLPTRAWELLAGSLLAVAPSTRFLASSLQRELAGFTGLGLILIPCFLYTSDTPFPGMAAVPPVAGAILLIASGDPLPRNSLVTHLLSWRPLVFVGLISYSLYLWHWPILVFARYQNDGPFSLTTRFALVAAGFVVAVISWKYIEKPFRSRALFNPRRLLVAVNTAAFVSLLFVGFIVYNNDGFDYRLSEQTRQIIATAKRERKYHRNLELNDVPENLIPLGGEGERTDFFIWGDSHAMALLSGLDSLCRENEILGKAATHSVTAPVFDFYVTKKSGLNENAIPFGEAVMNYLRERRPKAIVLAASWHSYFEHPDFADALFSTIDRLKELEATIYFVKDVPTYKVDIATVAAIYSWRGRNLSELALSLKDYDAENWFHVGLLPQLQERGVTILDPIAVFRTRNKTNFLAPADAHGLLYHDADHLSTYGSHIMKPVFVPLIESLKDKKRYAK